MKKALFKNIKFKSLLILSVLFIYAFFSFVFFQTFNYIYYKNIKEKFIDENIIAAKSLSDWLITQQNSIGSDARILSDDSIIYNSFYSDSYIRIKKDRTHSTSFDPSSIEITPVNKLTFIKLSNEYKTKLNLYQSVKSEKNVALFARDGSLKGYSSSFLHYHNESLDAKYVANEVGSETSSLGAGGISLVDFINDSFIIKGIARVGIRDAIGAVMVTQRIDFSTLDDLKHKINKDVFIFKENKIINSTYYSDSIRVENYLLKATPSLKTTFTELEIGKRKLIISTFPIYDFYGNIIGYIGSGFDESNISTIYGSTISKIIPVEIIIAAIMFLSIFLILSLFFKPFTYILSGIENIKSGNYDKLIKTETVSGDLRVLRDSVNELAITVRDREGKLLQSQNELLETQQEVIFMLGTIGESRSKETGNHVKRVSEYSRLLAQYHDLESYEIKMIAEASSLHDIGKVAISDTILMKPDKLTPHEFEIIKKHSKIGYDLLKHSKRKIIKYAATIALQHHEKWDGTGYPNQLSQEDIHISARIVAISDVFDALSSYRCYKLPWNNDDIKKYFVSQSGKHFDPILTDLFLINYNSFLEIKETYKDKD